MTPADQPNQRRHDRLAVHLPIRAQIDRSDYQQMQVIDISLSGMQICSQDFEVLKRGFDAQHNRAEFDIRLSARMAWVQNDPDGYYLTGWEFVLDGPSMVRSVPVTEDEEADNKRQHPRLLLDLPIQAQVDRGEYQEMHVVDISPSGMQIRCEDFEVLKRGIHVHTNVAEFEILMEARLAWVQTGDDGKFLTGWEFELEGGEERIG
ncbi:MAG: PilZ domain-containing protein [bacterium]|nr:PilZ domain-containing protein [bacterium]